MAKQIDYTGVYTATVSGTSVSIGSETDTKATNFTIPNNGSALSTSSSTGKQTFSAPVTTTGSAVTLTYLGAVYDSTTSTWIGFIGEYNGQDYFYLTAGTAPSGTDSLFFSSSELVNGTGNGSNPTYTCFMAGTMIATPDGEVAVETIKAGDMVTLADGSESAVVWLGRQTVSTRFADPLRALPIRIMAGALAEGVPSRDLLVSPDHALLVDGILVHAAALVNGVSIWREEAVDEVFTYYHVEVAKHDLILAENTPVETFIDNVDRMNFDNWDEHSSEIQLTEMDLPRAKSNRQLPSATRDRLMARGEQLFGNKAAAAA